MRRHAIVLGLVILTAGLAGCIGEDGRGDDIEAQSEERDDAGPTMEDPNVSLEDDEQLYRYDASDAHEVRWENESFSPATCFACPSSEHRYDVTAMLAQDAPTRLRVELETDPVLVDATSVSLAADGAEVYRYNSTFDTIDAVLAPQGGSAEVVVQSLLPDADTEIAYELRIEAHANRSALPAQVPIAFPAPEDPAGLVVDDAELDGEAHLMLWDGEDTFLGHHPIEGETTINLTGAGGDELAAYLAGADGVARLAPINASAMDATMRPLGQTVQEASDSIDSNQQVELEAPIEVVPYRAGLFLEGSFDAGTQFSGELAVDGEPVFSYSSGGYLTGPDTRFTWWDEHGDPGLTAGAYLGTFQFTAASGGEAGVVWMTYAR